MVVVKSVLINVEGGDCYEISAKNVSPRFEKKFSPRRKGKVEEFQNGPTGWLPSLRCYGSVRVTLLYGVPRNRYVTGYFFGRY